MLNLINSNNLVVFKFKIYYIISRNCIFGLIESEITKIKTICGFLFFYEKNNTFVLIILCKSNFNMKFLDTLTKYGIKIENNLLRKYQLDYFNSIFYKLMNSIKSRKINCKICKIYFSDSNILKELLLKYTQNNNLFLDCYWYNYFTKQTFIKLKKIIEEIYNKKIESNIEENITESKISDNINYFYNYKKHKNISSHISIRDKLIILKKIIILCFILICITLIIKYTIINCNLY